MSKRNKKTARERLTSLLGDFPQGFNAGMLAGIPGWAGDIGYLLQEYPRALLTDTPLRPPVEYAGTTDSIAKAAGYEIPGTISGQLGAAVGGLLSPGPGDLAKFAPLFGAIPFWHGSPHKFDAFDLSKMGTGEGAQAYGWGAYGAQTKGTAEWYAKELSGAAQNSAPLPAGKLDELYGSSRLPKSLAEANRDFDAFVEMGWIGKDERNAFLSSVSDMFDPGNLYRGEYAWPDPAKEAATPLTGEDLLQWDKPLSEQPKIVEALRKAGMWDGPGKWAEATGAKGQDLVAIMEAKKGEKGAADFLSANGIPGIRYLDGMSRDGGSGTFNYVMFDDKGIKLLERNGKPIRGLLNP